MWAAEVEHVPIPVKLKCVMLTKIRKVGHLPLPLAKLNFQWGIRYDMIIYWSLSSDFHVVFIFKDIDDCLPNPCINGGECTNTMGSFTCQCESGLTGKFCEQGKLL